VPESFDAHCCHIGTAIKHPVPVWTYFSAICALFHKEQQKVEEQTKAAWKDRHQLRDS